MEMITILAFTHNLMIIDALGGLEFVKVVYAHLKLSNLECKV